MMRLLLTEMLYFLDTFRQMTSVDLTGMEGLADVLDGLRVVRLVV